MVAVNAFLAPLGMLVLWVEFRIEPSPLASGLKVGSSSPFPLRSANSSGHS